ncbi:hypothetical protein HDU98_003152 [Podochytrium sp. JEL0797]|nr:hypothetical protein HDU98_003152 [Podochytrium sp. JEL0797]
MIILRATEQHWSALSLLAQKTFSDTYGHTYEPHNVKKHLETNYTQSVITHEIQTELVFLVCDDDDVDGQRPWGFCQLKPNSRNELMPVEYPDPCWEIHRFYLDKDKKGVGAGSVLMKFSMEKLKEAGAKSLWLSCWSENFVAQRFYEKFGIKHSGKTFTYMVGDHADLEFLYVFKFK